MRNKLLCVLLLSALLCTPANADLVYTYTDSNGSGDVGLIDISRTDSGSLNAKPIYSVADMTFNNTIHISGYKKDNKAYALIAEHPVNPDSTVNSIDIAYIYNYDPSGDWTFSNSFNMTGAVNVRNVVMISANGDSLFAAAHGLDDQTVNSGVIEYYIPSKFAKRNSYVYPVTDGSVVHAEDLFIDGSYINTLFSVKSDDKWLQSVRTYFYGQFTKTRYTLLNPHAVDFALTNKQIVAACMGNRDDSGNIISGEVSIGGNTLVSADSDGNSIGEVLAVDSAYEDGFYFIASKDNVETLYYCTTTDRSNENFSVVSVDNITPSTSSSYLSNERRILWDDSDKLTVVMAGEKIMIIDDTTESRTIKEFSTLDLGGYPSSMSLITESSSSTSKKNNKGCNAAYLGLMPLIVPALFAFKLKRKNKK